MQDVLKSSILQAIYREAQRSGQPIYCIVDDTIASHTRPSSQAVHPIEAAYFHQSHLKGCQDYGHQVVSVMLSCNGITLNYAVILYDKSRSKIQIVQEIAEELPAAPVISYFLCDSWYTTAKVMDRFIRKGFYTVGALKTNRILYPCGIRQKASAFALHLRKTDPDVSLVTVGSREFYVYRYEGGVEWHSKCSGDPQLSEGWIWESQSIACISLYKCRVIHAGDPGHLYETVAD
ncbi:MAG: transposase [Lacrimispora saccharolytica]